MNQNIFTRRANAKNYRLRVKTDNSVHITVPRYGSLRRAKKFLADNQEWISKQQQKITPQPEAKKFTDAEIKTLRIKAKAYIIPRTAELAAKHNFTFNNITIKKIRSRWGSCSAKKNLNFSLYLALLEPKYIDYVILHELCHTIHMHHQKSFWDLVEQVCPGAKKIDRELKKFQIGRID